MIYVDDMRVRATVGQLTAVWSHLFSDTSVEELDEFAEKLRLNPRWLQNSDGFIHYDVVESKRQQAIKLGATPISYRELGEHVKNSYMQRTRGRSKALTPHED